MLAPFLNKAVHIDDTLFLNAARHIQGHPLDFYGFTVNWYGREEPMHGVMMNPPLMSYFLAGSASLVGWSEPALHAVCLIPAVGVVVGTYALGLRLGIHGGLASLLTLLTPVFMVSATALMCDVTMLCFWLWAMVLWDVGVQSRSPTALACAVLLITASALTKYFGISVIGLIALYTIARTRRVDGRLAWMAVPIIAGIAYHFWTGSLYGHSLLAAAMDYPGMFAQQEGGHSWMQVLAAALSFTGGCQITMLFMLPACARWWWMAASVVALGAVGAALLSTIPAWSADAFPWTIHVQYALFVAAGSALLIVSGCHLALRRDAVALLLVAWIAGVFIFMTMINWTVAGRTVLPMTPAIALLLARHVEPRLREAVHRRWIIGPTLTAAAALSFTVAWADMSFANAAREGARRLITTYAAPNRTIWFQGHWGFQHYMEQGGAKPVDSDHWHPAANDVIVVPTTNYNLAVVPEMAGMVNESITVPVLPWLSANCQPNEASFYTCDRGLLPFAFGPVPDEVFSVYPVAPRSP